jgi:uncharacterized protein with beta-barrel porin domain
MGVRVATRSGRIGLWGLLASSSITALLVGGGAPAAFAACNTSYANTTAPGCTNASAITGIAINNSTLTSSITNAGTISPNGIVLSNGSTVNGAIVDTGSLAGGISLDHTSRIAGGATSAISIFGPTFTGGISNAGTVTGFRAINIFGGSLFAGGITNSGAALASGSTGLRIDVTSFSGNISNSGSISGTNGIVLGVSTFSGAIINSGSITATVGEGIEISGGTTYSGGVSNSGTISAVNDGIAVSSLNQFGSSTGGGITNSGMIAGGRNAIVVSNIGQFGSSNGGGITNSGTISAAVATVVAVVNISKFAGGISNSGLIAGSGIYVDVVSTFLGGIVNSGTISASFVSIDVAKFTTFLGGISNSGFSNDIHVISAASHGTVTVSTFGGGVVNSGTISSPNPGIFVGGQAFSAGTLVLQTFSGGISNSGTISAYSGIEVGYFAQPGNSVTVSTFAGGITNSGTIIAASQDGISVGGGSGGSITISTFAGNISNAGTITAADHGIIVGGTSRYPGTVTISDFAGNISNSGRIVGATGILIAGGVTFGAGGVIVNSGTIAGTAIDVSGASSAMTIDQTGGLVSGAIKLSANADQLNISGGSIAGNVVGSGTQDTINFNLGSGTFTYNADFTGINQVNVNSGTVVLNGANSATNVAVDGGGALAGTGSIDPTTVTINNGGILAPGSSASPFGTFSITGTLTFNAGSYYAVNISPSGNNSETALAGNAVLGGNGTVVVTPQQFTLGAHGAMTYTILTASGGGSGTFAGVVDNGNYTGAMTLDYTADDVILQLGAGSELLSTPSGASQNQQNVVNGINNSILSGGTPPANFQTLNGLSGQAYLNALTQLDGEDATGAEKGAFQLMTQFLDLLTDPSGSGGNNGGAGVAPGFAEEESASLPPDVALAYAKALHQKSAPTAQGFEQRWNAWGAGYGGAGNYDGNPAVGSTNVNASDYGYAAGMTYHVTPTTSYGFALAGGGTNWTLAQSLGSGRSDSFQAGVYGTTHFGPAYLSGALAFANHWFTTNRIALGDDLTAKFQGQSYAARGEAGYRYAVPVTGYIVGVTPYAALQVQDFHTPSYSETDLSGGGFGLTYNAVNATDTRSELGARFDNLTVWNGMPLVLRGRLAWAHDWVSNPALGAVFQALPGSNFTVNGAAPPKNSALTTAGAELHLSANWTAMAKFDGEFGSGSQTYAGTGTLKYSW